MQRRQKKRGEWMMLLTGAMLALPGTVNAGDSFTLDITGSTTVNWDTAAWVNTTNLNRVGGYPNDGLELPLGSDDVLINFAATTGTQVPQLDFTGTSRTINSLEFTEGANNADANFLSSGGDITLTLRSIDYSSGGREIDFFSSVNVADVVDGSALMISSASTTDYQGIVSGSEGLVIGARGGSITFRNFQITGAITNNATSGTFRFGFDASVADVVHTIPSLTIADNDAAHHFFRSTGTNSVTVNIDQLSADAAGINTIRVGGSSGDDNVVDTTVNINGPAITFFPGSQAPNGSGTSTTTRTFVVSGNYAGVVNLNTNLRQDQTLGTEILVFQGDGVLNLNAQLQGLDGAARAGRVIIDGTRSLEIGVSDASVFGAAQIEVRSGTILRYDYDVNTFGYGGGGLLNISGTSISDNSGGVALVFNAPQTGFVDPLNVLQPLTIRTYNSLAGDLTNGIFSGVNQNIVLEEDAVLGPTTGATLPTRAELGGPKYWQALTSNEQVVTDIGDDGVSIYKGWAFSPLLHNGGQANTADDSVTGFHGTLSAIAGQNLQLLVSSNTRFARRVTGNKFATLNSDTGIADFLGVKELALEGNGGAAWDGTVTTINRIGNDQFSAITSQNANILRVGGTDAIDSGQTVNVTHGRAIIEDATAVNQGGVLNVGPGALLDLNSSSAITRGDVNINAGGGILWNSTQTFNLNSASVWNVTPGTLLVIDGDQNVDTPALQNATSTTAIPALAPVMDIVLQDADADVLSGTSLKLGQDRVLTGFASGNADLQGGSTGIEAFAGVTNVIIAGVTRLPENGGNVRTFTLSNLINLPDTDLQIGKTGTFQTVVGSTGLNTTREDVELTGIVSLQGGDATGGVITSENLIRNVNVVAGRLLIGSQEGTPVVGNNATHITGDLVISSLTSNGSHQFLDGSVRVDGNIVLAPAGAVQPDNGSGGLLFINADFTAGVANLLQDRVLNNTLTGGADGIRIHDFGGLQLQIAEDEVNGNPTDINQRITIARTALSASQLSGFDRAIIVEAVGTTTTNSNIMNLRDVHLMAGSILTIDEAGSSSVRADLTLRGDATVAETTGSGTTSEDFDLLDIQSDVGGSGRTLKLGTTTMGNDTTFNTRLFGTSSADITLELVNAQLNYDTSDLNVAINGSIIVRELGLLITEVDTANVSTMNVTNPILIDSPLASRLVSLGSTRSPGVASGSATLIYDNVTLTAGSLLAYNRSNTFARLNLILEGDAHLGDLTSGSADDFDLQSVVSSSISTPRTLFYGTTGDAVDESLEGTLRGISSADITLDIVNGTLTVLTNVGGDIQGNVIIRAGQSLVISGGSDTINNVTVFGTVDFASGGSLVVAGTLSGTGDVNGPVTVTGALNPGASIGTIDVSELMLANGAILGIELGDVGIDESDKINVTGLLDVAGGTGLVTIDIDALVGIGQQLGTYTLLTFGSILGDESNFALTGDLTLGYDYNISVTASAVLLTVAETVIPEPGTLGLLLVSAAALRRRKR